MEATTELQGESLTYISEQDLNKISLKWGETINVVREAVRCMAENDYAQPVKPYLRYGNLANRIIAMPAFIGGNFNKAGIKWISSFPSNTEIGLPRAHSVVILNNAVTGVPQAIINTPLLSVLRTASVSGLILNEFINHRNNEGYLVGIIGWGPIGQYHYKMCTAVLGKKLKKITLFDLKPIDPIITQTDPKIHLAENWEEIVRECDIVITCTVSQSPYIDIEPKKGSLHLNVSLRDYKTAMYEYFKNAIIVDEWEEVCRENTDIENMAKEKGLTKEGTYSIKEVIKGDFFNNIPKYKPIQFNPMGMAIFDIAISTYFYKKSLEGNLGNNL